MYTRCVTLSGGCSLQILQDYTSKSVEAIRGHPRLEYPRIVSTD
jgi:hypothetical protein